jgi:hypothetical protein
LSFCSYSFCLRLSYHYQAGAIAMGDPDAKLRESICVVFDTNDSVYGKRRMKDELVSGSAR